MTRGSAWAHPARILRQMVSGPQSAFNIAAGAKCAVTGCRLTLRQMRALGLVHIGGWMRVEGKRTGWFPLWSLGGSEDCECPAGRLANRPVNPARPHLELIGLAVALRALMSEPQSLAMLAELTGRPGQNTGRGLRALRAAKLVHIDHWERNRCGSPTAFYAWGPGSKDAERPRPIPHKVLWRASERKRRDKRRQMKLMLALAGNSDAFKLKA